jgi:hypothetical protein
VHLDDLCRLRLPRTGGCATLDRVGGAPSCLEVLLGVQEARDVRPAPSARRASSGHVGRRRREAVDWHADRAFLLALLTRSRRSRGEVMLTDFELAIVDPPLFLRDLERGPAAAQAAPASRTRV